MDRGPSEPATGVSSPRGKLHRRWSSLNGVHGYIYGDDLGGLEIRQESQDVEFTQNSQDFELAQEFMMSSQEFEELAYTYRDQLFGPTAAPSIPAPAAPSVPVPAAQFNAAPAAPSIAAPAAPFKAAPAAPSVAVPAAQFDADAPHPHSTLLRITGTHGRRLPDGRGYMGQPVSNLDPRTSETFHFDLAPSEPATGMSSPRGNLHRRWSSLPGVDGYGYGECSGGLEIRQESQDVEFPQDGQDVECAHDSQEDLYGDYVCDSQETRDGECTQDSLDSEDLVFYHDTQEKEEAVKQFLDQLFGRTAVPSAAAPAASSVTAAAAQFGAAPAAPSVAAAVVPSVAAPAAPSVAAPAAPSVATAGAQFQAAPTAPVNAESAAHFGAAPPAASNAARAAASMLHQLPHSMVHQLPSSELHQVPGWS